MRAVLADVGLADVVDALPHGVDSPLGEAGAGLSQGQRQRLSLARALLREAPVTLLDEPTAALDEETERVVLAAIRARTAGRTVVLVTHRAAPLDIADHAVHLSPAGPPAVDEHIEPDPRLSAVGPW